MLGVKSDLIVKDNEVFVSEISIDLRLTFTIRSIMTPLKLHIELVRSCRVVVTVKEQIRLIDTLKLFMILLYQLFTCLVNWKKP